MIIIYFLIFIIIIIIIILFLLFFLFLLPGAGHSSEVKRSFIVGLGVGSIPHGGPIGLCPVPASSPQLV